MMLISRHLLSLEANLASLKAMPMSPNDSSYVCVFPGLQPITTNMGSSEVSLCLPKKSIVILNYVMLCYALALVSCQSAKPQ